jgi:hypothetical protein
VKTLRAINWSQRQWGEKLIFRHVVLSVLGWTMMYMVFYLEVSRLKMHSQHAKLSITPLGFPVGILIQWLVFKDKLKSILSSMSLRKALRRHGSRWLVIKVVSFAANQVGYAVTLHMAGLPFWAAYPVSAAALSLLYFAISNWWVLKAQDEVRQIDTA